MVRIEGRAAQGTLQHVAVNAYALEGDTRRHLGSVRTDERGDFAFTLDRDRAPFLFEVTAPEDGAARMICGAVSGCGDTAFGEEGRLPEHFRLTAMVLRADLHRASVAVTPLTHLATGWARALPGRVSARDLRLARARVADALNLEPDFAFQRLPDITVAQGRADTGSDADHHALLAAAFAERATRAGRDLQFTINGYLEAFINHDGRFRDRGAYSRRALFQGAQEIARRRGLLDSDQAPLQSLIAGRAGSASVSATNERL